MHESRVRRKAGARKVSSERERCILYMYGLLRVYGVGGIVESLGEFSGDSSGCV